MNAFQFGRQIREKIAAGPTSPQLMTTGTRLPRVVPPKQRTSGPTEPTMGQFGRELGRTVSAVVPGLGSTFSQPRGTGWGSYLDKWYNPATKNKDPMSRGEETLMRTGQGALATGAAALTGAAGLAAMTPGAAAAAGTGAATASQTPTGQAILQRGGQLASNAAATGMNAAGDVAAHLQTRLPHSVMHGWHRYSEAMEPIEKTFPHMDKYLLPFETAAHYGTHALEHAGHGGHAVHAGVAGH